MQKKTALANIILVALGISVVCYYLINFSQFDQELSNTSKVKYTLNSLEEFQEGWKQAFMNNSNWGGEGVITGATNHEATFYSSRDICKLTYEPLSHHNHLIVDQNYYGDIRLHQEHFIYYSDDGSDWQRIRFGEHKRKEKAVRIIDDDLMMKIHNFSQNVDMAYHQEHLKLISIFSKDSLDAYFMYLTSEEVARYNSILK
ncbi:hypothetical protein [Fulvivirga ligni]|uniref:hypothetical protein n=1 Tax=Fulvivirga ligni TaxID=2904246 RepID=UPI001F232E1A|nr:hypothetical protein [Fulvivirga ligni]UII19569.1 hypothetical protein LVD16_17150 [Fulvivirga ligni]